MIADFLLCGLDASNPLAFLAALGALRLLSTVDAEARLHWRFDIAWRPVLTGVSFNTEEELCRRLAEIDPIPDDLVRILGKNLTVAPAVFQCFMAAVEEDLVSSSSRCGADFAASFGSEVCVDSEKDRIEYTKFSFITGSGHQDFVETARALVRATKPEHIREALFGPWRRADPGLSMRWDPSDAAEYALKWDNPGPQGVSSVWGANRLAIEALPLFPVMPTSRGLLTTGFDGAEFTWPVWDAAVNCDTVRSLLAQTETPRQELTAMGIREMYRARRVRIGQGANFKVSFRPARAV